MRVVFRTDASQDIGSGHVMRCLTLAHALQGQGADVLFICRTHPGNLITLIREEGFSCRELPVQDGWILDPEKHATWLGAPAELDAAHTMASTTSSGIADWLIVDHYGVGLEWEQWMRPACRNLMVIDDLADRAHDCDLLLDQNLADQQASRYDRLVADHCVKLLGPRYALLQTAYADLHRQAAPRHLPARRVFAYFGAADSHNFCGRVAQAFLQVADPEVTLDMVVSPTSPHWPALSGLARQDARIRLHGHVPSLAPLLQSADVAFGAGGATSWERCCLGVPAYVVTLADNQLPGSRALARQGAIRWLGNAEQVSDAGLREAMQEALKGEHLSAMSAAALSLVDGWGSARVLAAMAADMTLPFAVRSVEPADERLTLDWANDPEVRQSSFSAERIEALTHHHWLARRMADTEGCRFYIVETASGLPAGPVRFERLSPDEWEIHYSMDRCLRGRGTGTAFLKAALDHFCHAVTSATRIIGRVKPSNQASQHIFRKLGFSQSADSHGLRYQLNL
ncbi:UDP-2,4-diacetamido-2,4,6-trideoxy-beta-L-altropyranose hydrolase [Laribacter hongkongensis]|uniref:UDP-2,4-diacetamido-2,4, 6-trideoxy-beta-L-altropyranose hydrolase n=1 Tax=Laribacter hongkongensis TaxID=168471 RepID=UPI0003FA73A1|nr:UDP-2,4-diacetamido-2,4,6-trideoxy-beta-L-altropyranose hydrolase [Laribacter hongkongensis]